MQDHTTLGFALLAGAGVELLDVAAEIACSHHERWDGGGYPRGLAGEAIPLPARIVAVADAFDAITSDRVYRVGKSYEAAAREIEEWAGRQFDPSVVEAFRRVSPEEWEALRRKPSSRAGGRGARANSIYERRRFASNSDGAKRGLRRPTKFQRARAY